ncbi:ATP-binding protein [Clostridium sp. AM58-1XD]|uniref:PAS domain-containing sensor histidine kinase n=1 Tax=Clostridium sp. AM58-1XD TaxID=2292307 RepID=UPI0026AA1739
MESNGDLTLKKCQSRPAADTAAQCGIFMDTIGISVIKFLLDQDLTIIYANDCFYKNTGYSEDEFHSLFPTLRQYYEKHIDEFEKLRTDLASLQEKGDAVFTADLRLPVKNGNYIWLRMNGAITNEGPDGRFVSHAVCSDISDLVCEKDQKFHYFQWMMDEYVGNVYISDMDTYELLYVNHVSCETLQLPRDQVIGKKCYELIQGRTSPCPFCTNDRICADEFYEWEFFNPVLDRTFMIKNRVINWNGHRARIELSHDMYSTEYKLAKKDREREALLRTIPGGFARLDARDMKTVLWYGADFLNVIGYTKEQFENELHSQCTYIHPDDADRIRSVLKEIQITGESSVLESRVITHSGDIRLMTMTLCYASGEESWDGIPSFYSVGINVTGERQEQERQRKALEDAYQAAQVANSAKTNFLSSMSHDIRTPMNAIMGMAAIAQANLLSPDKVHDCLAKINVSSRHLLSLINEVLDMSKIESGKIDLMPEEVHLPDLIQNVTDMCKPLIAEKHQEFQISVGQVSHERIIADGDRLQQVFMNLLSNSIKYTPEGGKITLRINEIPSLIDKKGQYEFIFTDTGIGMEEAYIPHIFEPFSRAEDSRISKIQGTGLGMAITENIIRMMNGSIDVKSRPGEGSCFTVSVQFELVGDEESCDKELEGLPVLVVDDDQVV